MENCHSRPGTAEVFIDIGRRQGCLQERTLTGQPRGVQEHQIKHPLVVDSADALDPGSQRTIHCYKIVSSADANGPVLTVLLDENSNALAMTAERQQAFDKAVLHTIGFTQLPTTTIQPSTNALTLSAAQEFDEPITVTIPKSAGFKVVDVDFLTNTTLSMFNVLPSVQAGANNLLAAFNGLGTDIVFGVGTTRRLP